ncbi:hypothetical protein [Allokutzneria albata]|uniref:Uncharacterized protein n=1 Tax=Allokutzneria albata TaxID=211114 RepID=A0A1G9ZES6_ALLAB|nr:hypothetical protein [Allokutzneria albata]SDN19829.1 hypothetical protein SAMN04489726_5461 [Allokutzneria albata]
MTASPDVPMAGIWRSSQCTGWELPVANPRASLAGVKIPPVLGAGGPEDNGLSEAAKQVPVLSAAEPDHLPLLTTPALRPE